MHDNETIGVAWFDEVQWQLLVSVAPDRNDLDDTFQDWERSALSVVRTLESQGHAVKRVAVNVAALCEWCAERKLPVNGAARAEYILALLKQADISG